MSDYQKRIEEILGKRDNWINSGMTMQGKINIADFYDKLTSQLLSLLQEVRSEGYEEGKMKIRKPIYEMQHKYNRTPKRIEQTRHRYHKRVGTSLDNCGLCKKLKI